MGHASLQSLKARAGVRYRGASTPPEQTVRRGPGPARRQRPSGRRAPARGLLRLLPRSEGAGSLGESGAVQKPLRVRFIVFSAIL